MNADSTKLRILIIAAANISTCPRAMRMIDMLKDFFDLEVMGIDSTSVAKMHQIPDIKTHSYKAYKKRNFLQEVKLYFDVLFKRWEHLALLENRIEIARFLRQNSFDLIICHDLLLLPVIFLGLDENLALDSKNLLVISNATRNTKIIFDAREFYPWQNLSSFRWKMLFSKFNSFLCRHFASKCDRVLSVSPNFCDLYKKHFDITATLFMSLPYEYDLSPSVVERENIRILYHGALNENRGILELLDIVKKLHKRFSIDFVFVGGREKFRFKVEQKIKRLQAMGARIRLLPPVDFKQIIPFGNAYDVGILYFPTHNLNAQNGLPNKLFEYIQSNLAIVLPPIYSFMQVLKEFDNCVVAKDFCLDSLVESINSLTKEQILALKQNSHIAAKTLNLTKNKQKILQIINELFVDNLKLQS